MEKIRINPENYREDYISNLNESFGNWGGDREYEWGLERKIGVHSTDIMLIENDQDGVIAGSAVSYRKLESENSSFGIGIMTGSWTLPAARRKGCFTKMIRCSRDLCKENEVPFLTAFVTEENASSRRLESEGSFMFPTYHLFSPEMEFDKKGLPNVEILQKDGDVELAIFKRFQETQKKFLNFSYAFEEFRSQYLDRIKETAILKIGEDFVLYENGRNEVKILLLTYSNLDHFRSSQMALTNWCIQNKRQKSFFFTTRKELSEVCQEIGFSNLPGYFTILGATDDNVNYDRTFKDLNINMGDKM